MTDQLLINKEIAIIGAGPGGLTLARLLQMNGADVKVYEREVHRDARAKGATLDLHEDSGLRALEVAGLMNDFKAKFRPGAERLRIMDKYASILLDDHENPDSDISRPEIDRGPLQDILLDSLLPGTVVWDRQFLSLSEKNGTIKLDFQNSTSAFAHIVIAADGARSRIRPYITDIKPVYSGVTMVEGAVSDSAKNTPRVHELLKGGKLFILGDSKSLIVSSKGDGSLVFYTGCQTAENWVEESGIDFTNKEQVAAWFKQEFAGWNDVWQELFENATCDFIPRPQYCMPLDQTWATLPNITMLGDAAHLMPPFAGEGVNMAMQDALELATCLQSEDYSDIHSAIAAYESQMRARASETAKITLESTEALHSPGAIGFMTQVMG